MHFEALDAQCFEGGQQEGQLLLTAYCLSKGVNG
jgi:hypothetical protein